MCLVVLLILIAAVFCGVFFHFQYKTYKTKKVGGRSSFPFVFSDTMGLDPTSGIQVDDVILALKGHVKDRYKVKFLHFCFPSTILISLVSLKCTSLCFPVQT